jgi:nucleoside-diphosphate-sugar epimerase/predicted dehydrogenase
VAAQAAAAGVHLYIEKPLAATEADARAIADGAAAAGVRVCPGHNRLFDPPIVELVRRVDAGEIGRVVSVRAEAGFAADASAHAAEIPWGYRYGWGLFDNLAPHPLYLACRFLQGVGDPLVHGFNLGRVAEASVEEIRVLLPAREAVGEIVFSLTAAPETNRVEVVGTAGRLVADFSTLGVTAEIPGGLPGPAARVAGPLQLSRQHAAATLRLSWGVLSRRVRRYMGMRTLIALYYDTLRRGEPPPVDPEEGVRNAALLETIRDRCRPSEKTPRPRSAPASDAAKVRVLVTGASGFLGASVARHLARSGRGVRGMTRLSSRAPAIEGVEWIEGDLRREADARRALEGVREIVHCAALAGAPGTLAQYLEANVDATMRLVRLAAEAGVESFVHVSSISIYAPPGANPEIDEEGAEDPRASERGSYTQSKLAADRALRDYARQTARPRIVLIRPGTIYGPGRSLPLGKLTLPSPWKRRPLIVGSRRRTVPLVYVDDVAEAARLALDSPAASGTAFNLVDAPSPTQAELAAAIRAATGGRVRPAFLPYPVAWTLMLGLDLLALLRGRPATARYRLRRTLAEMRYPSRRARRELLWKPSVSLAEGLRRSREGSASAP